MTPDVVAVLVVPAEGDPGGLLRARLICGSPPAVHQCNYGRWLPGIGGSSLSHGCLRCGRGSCRGCMHPEPATALPLWWDGALVPEGWDRLCRVMYDAIPPEERYDSLPRAAYHPALSEVLHQADVAVRLLGVRVVCLARVDGRLVEV